MRITQASVFTQFQPFAAGPYVCRGHTEDGFDSTLVKLETDTGLVGWGEVAPLGLFYSDAFAGGARAGLAELLPRLIGEDPRQLARLNVRMDDLLAGHPYVKTPVDMACWDLLGKVSGLPIAELAGGRFGDTVPLYRSVSQAEPDAMAAQARAFVQAGYRRIQVKVGDDPLDDAERLQAVRAAVGADVLLLADANGAWTADAALRFVQKLGSLDYYLEQPCRSLADNTAVRRHTRQPMILDESITSLDDLLAAHQLGVPNGVTLKLSRVGGLSAARLIRDVAVRLGLRVCIEDTGGSDVDTAATAHLMLSTPEANRFHTVDFMNWVTVSNATGMPPAHDGHLAAPSGPGLGLHVLEDALEPLAVYA
ncbi:MAG: mandelate racemase/muconate lactonizing enzyme family protein [Pseudomonadota bacterium]